MFVTKSIPFLVMSIFNMAAAMRFSVRFALRNILRNSSALAIETHRLAARSNLIAQKLISSVNHDQVRHHSYDPEGKTTVSILNKDSEMGLMIDSYSQMGFRLNNGIAVLGPLALFPRSLLTWNVESVADITKESLSLFYMLEPKIDILVIGVGDPGKRLNPEVITFLRSKGIGTEILPTEQACSTFNFLNAEKRYVAGAFIPPSQIKITDDDVILSKARHRMLYEIDD